MCTSGEDICSLVNWDCISVVVSVLLSSSLICSALLLKVLPVPEMVSYSGLDSKYSTGVIPYVAFLEHRRLLCWTQCELEVVFREFHSMSRCSKSITGFNYQSAESHRVIVTVGWDGEELQNKSFLLHAVYLQNAWGKNQVLSVSNKFICIHFVWSFP